MKPETRLYAIRARSPLHVGSGQGVGFIDLPIAREVATGYPYVPGSAVKGVFADACEASEDGRKDDESKDQKYRHKAYLKRLAFGVKDSDGAEKSANAGCLVFTDARLLCLPVRSLYGTFAWCTCPFVLRRLAADLQRSDRALPWKNGKEPGIPTVAASQGAAGPGGGAAAAPLPMLVPDPASSALVESGTKPNVFLEDLDFEAKNCADVAAWAGPIAEVVFSDSKHNAWRDLFCKRFAVVHDDIFGFLCETATQVDARIKIGDSGTVEGGALWYEECLPEETILTGLVWCGPVWGRNAKKEQELNINDQHVAPGAIVKKFCDAPNGRDLQIGGNASVGRGQVTLRFTSGQPRAPSSTAGASP